MTSRAWLWLSLAVLALVLAEIATIPVIYLAEFVLGLPHSAGLALWAGSRVLLAGLVTLVLGRILLRPPPGPSTTAWVILLLGAGLSALVQVALLSWSEQRFGLFEPDLLGVTRHLYAVVGLVAVTGFATVVAPREAAQPPFAGVVIGLSLTVAVGAANLGGLADGLAADSVPLALTVGLTLLYAFVVTALGWRAQRGAAVRENSPA